MLKSYELSKLEKALVCNLLKLYRAGCGYPEKELNLEGWKDRATIADDDKAIPHQLRFSSDFSNITNLMNRLIKMGLVEKRRRPYTDDRNRPHEKVEYRLISGKRGFVKLFPYLYVNDLVLFFLVDSDYFMQERNRLGISVVLDEFMSYIESFVKNNDHLEKLANEYRTKTRDNNEFIIAGYPELLFHYITNKKHFIKFFKTIMDEFRPMLQKGMFFEKSSADLFLLSFLVNKWFEYEYEYDGQNKLSPVLKKMIGDRILRLRLDFETQHFSEKLAGRLNKN